MGSTFTTFNGMPTQEFANETILVTGGAGFIGSALVHYLMNKTQANVINLDFLTYAGNIKSVEQFDTSSRYHFMKADINSVSAIREVLNRFKPSYVMHLAAETHVDRSIDSAEQFIQTNINGTFTLLEECYKYWKKLDTVDKESFRFLHVSTDEVFGSLAENEFFDEDSNYAPNSPYSASKAASDHLVRAWYHTYGLPTLITNCSNNYGPRQFPEKFIPVVIINALLEQPIPLYGQGQNQRDWIYVDDHVQLLTKLLRQGTVGETYLIGGNAVWTNKQMIQMLLELFDEFTGRTNSIALVTPVKDRPGHDLRYAIDIGKVERELFWYPQHTIRQGLRKTIQWYLENQDWWQPLYKNERLGLHL